MEKSESFIHKSNSLHHEIKILTWTDVKKNLENSFMLIKEKLKTLNYQQEWSKYHCKLASWHKFTQDIFATTDDNNGINLNIISDVADRIHNQLISLDAEIKNIWKTGHILHRQITNILHAILVVTSDIPGRLESPKTSDEALFKVLSSIEKSPNALHPLAACIISCPLLWLFLDPDTTSGNQANTLLSTTVSTLLSRSINIKPNKNSEENTNNEKTGKDNIQKKCNESKPNFLDFTSPQSIPIEIGRGTIESPDIIYIRGFFDVLNVVPRYYKNN